MNKTGRMIQKLKKIKLNSLINKRCFCILLTVLYSCNPQQSFYSASDFEKVPKTDAHFHYLTKNTAYIIFAKSIQFKLMTPIWEGEEVSIDIQFDLSSSIQKRYASDYAFFASFPTDSINYTGFAERTVQHIKKSIESGASGIKIWKNIGMVIKYPDGRYIMADDPVFEPVFQFLEKEKIPVIAHLGEPKNCWLPFSEMTDKGDSSYYQNHTQYYMYLHPEVPSYDTQIKARDDILKKYPELDFTGAHLGSLEWSIDELAKRFDTYPNFSVDMAGRIGHLKNQSRIDYERVRNFLIKYQDRISYGSDYEVHDHPELSPDDLFSEIRNGWFNDWLYLATDSIVNNTKGLHLPKKVIDKIYFENAERYFQKLPVKSEVK
jgi:predicted TIM-barrel fold metal-dependent hydrolase